MIVTQVRRVPCAEDYGDVMLLDTEIVDLLDKTLQLRQRVVSLI